ncbi:TAF3 [Mytilus coruscus]|uniref:TAF3 n=1 Tax=Mytilus coruscus TaxID=42192 RepID=A0A6J8D2Y3_MYTCO|nr:TAF3 [Mytilus coruscus]
MCCDECDIWHHRSCIELYTVDYELLQRSNIQWLCCKCESINVSSFTFHSCELNTSNYYEALTHEISFESVSSAAVNYIKPDNICGKESWLKGEKPGKTNTKDAIKFSEVFPDDYTAYRNDRRTHVGGVSILVYKDIISVEQSSLVTNYEIEWIKIHLKGKKELLIVSFYMPYRNMKYLDELEKTVQMTASSNTNIMLTGDLTVLI